MVLDVNVDPPAGVVNFLARNPPILAQNSVKVMMTEDDNVRKTIPERLVPPIRLGDREMLVQVQSGKVDDEVGRGPRPYFRLLQTFNIGFSQCLGSRDYLQGNGFHGYALAFHSFIRMVAKSIWEWVLTQT
jgi:hypothetical protein